MYGVDVVQNCHFTAAGRNFVRIGTLLHGNHIVRLMEDFIRAIVGGGERDLMAITADKNKLCVWRQGHQRRRLSRSMMSR